MREICTFRLLKRFRKSFLGETLTLRKKNFIIQVTMVQNRETYIGNRSISLPSAEGKGGEEEVLWVTKIILKMFFSNQKQSFEGAL